MSTQEVSPQLAYVRWVRYASTTYIFQREEVFETRAREAVVRDARQFLETLSIIFDKPSFQLLQSESTWIGPITEFSCSSFNTFELAKRIARDVVDWTREKEAWIEERS